MLPLILCKASTESLTPREEFPFLIRNDPRPLSTFPLQEKEKSFFLAEELAHMCLGHSTVEVASWEPHFRRFHREGKSQSVRGECCFLHFGLVVREPFRILAWKSGKVRALRESEGVVPAYEGDQRFGKCRPSCCEGR